MKITILITYTLLILATSLIPMHREVQGLNFIINLKASIQNLLHIPAYALLAILWLDLLKSYVIRRSTRTWLVIVSVVGFGVLNECVQMVVPGRYAGVMDMGLNAVGALTGILIHSLYGRMITSRPLPLVSQATRDHRDDSLLS